MNVEVVINRIEPYLNNENEIYEEDFENLFSILRKHEKYQVVDILIEHGIEINYDKKTKKTVGKNDQSEKNKIIEPVSEPDPILDLTHMTNEQLCIMYQRGKVEVLYSIYKKNEGFINKMVNRYINYYHQKLSFDDLKIEAFFGLRKAIERFDISLENKFITYAGAWIIQSITRAIADYGFTIRVPVHMVERVNKIFRILKKYNLEPDSFESYEVVALELEISKEQYCEAVNIMKNIIQPVSLDLPVGEDGDSTLINFIEEHLPSVEDQVIRDHLHYDLENILRLLKDKERDIIIKRFGLFGHQEMTLEEIGIEYGVTRERIRQIEEKTLRKLRHPSRQKLIKGYLEV